MAAGSSRRFTSTASSTTPARIMHNHQSQP